MKNTLGIMAVTLIILIVIGVFAVYCSNLAKPVPQPPAKVVQAPKYRFDEPPCPDGLRVTYIDFHRRTRADVCQVEVGGK